MVEDLTDPTGSRYDRDGVPYSEVLDRIERRRGMFWRWRLDRAPETREPQTPLPPNLPSTEQPAPKVRGRPFQRGWNKPGI